MARIRFINPDLLTEEAYMAMSMTAKAAWPPIWTQCDDRGVFAWRPKTLKAAIFPDDAVDFEMVLEEWLQLGVVLCVEIDGNACGLVRDFCKVQTPKFPSYRHALTEEMARFVGWDREKLRGKKIRIPEDEAAQTTPALPQGCTSATPDLPRYDYDNVYVEVEDKPPSIPPDNASGTPAAPVGGGSPISGGDDGDGFQAFWEAYPPEARTAPDYARRAYAKALKLGATPEGILAALRRDLERAGKRQPLAPAAWLNGGSWRMVDEPPAIAPPRGNVAPIDQRFDGWEVGDHMALRQWRAARENHWMTPDPRRNALSEDGRRLDLWATINGNRPRVANFLAEYEPDGVPVEVAA